MYFLYFDCIRLLFCLRFSDHQLKIDQDATPACDMGIPMRKKLINGDRTLIEIMKVVNEEVK